MHGPGDGIRVLHVDDEPDLIDMVATFLEREDERITVQAATTAEDGRTILADHDIDCIVSDYDMPETSGIEFLEAVREDYPDLPFILYTGKGSEEVASDAISAGVTDYLQKESGTDQYAILANRVVNSVERYRAEREAALTRTQLHAISNHSTDAIVIIDAESRIHFANPAIEDHFGYRPSELTGKRLTTIIPERNREEHLAAVERYLETGERTLNWTNVEFPGLHKDGSEFPLSVSFGEFQQDGAHRFIGIMRDISERTRMEAELREREERFRQLAENIEEVVWMSDPGKDELLYVNPAYEDIWGQSTDSLYDDPTSFLESVHPEDQNRVEAALDTQTDGAYDEEYRIVRPDGELRWVHDRAVPVENDAGEIYRIVGISSDVTERKERTRQLETLISNLPGIVYRCRNEPGWPMRLVRGECEQLTGYAAETLERSDDIWGEEIIHPEDRDRMWAAVQEALDDDRPFEVTYRIRTKDGDTRWMWERGRVVNPGYTEETLLEGFITDITDRKEHEIKRQQIIGRMNDAVIEVDADWQVTLVNERTEGLTGLDESALLGRAFWDVFPEARGTHFEDEYRRAMETREPVSIVEYYEGLEEWFDIDVYPNRDGGLAFYFRRITEFKERERRLEQYEKIVESMDDGAFVVDDEWNVEFANESIVEFTDAPLDALEGQPVMRLSDEYLADADDAARFEHAIERIFEGELPSDSPERLELTLDTESGQVTFEYQFSPLVTDGETNAVVVTTRDITDRTRQAEQLRALNERSRMLMTADTSEQIAEIGVEAAREVLELNASAIHLYDTETSSLVPVAATDDVYDLIGDPPEFWPGDSIAWRAYDAGEALAFENVQDHPDRYNPETAIQSELHLPLGDHGMLLAGSPTPNAFDEQDYVLGRILAANIASALDQVAQTERLRAREAELTHQNDRLEEFASIVSHDLRNPLNVAEGRLELVAEECDSEHLEPIEHALDRMDALIEDLLSLAHEGEAVSDLGPVGLKAVAEGCWENVETADATLVVDAARAIYADESRLKQVFENLIRNAVEHGDDGVTVTIGELDDGFYVEDDGPGISEDRRDDVFDAGFSTNRDGTGFGLNIVERVADAHDWEIHVTESADGGARFEITGVEFVDE